LVFVVKVVEKVGDDAPADTIVAHTLGEFGDYDERDFGGHDAVPERERFLLFG
jgi:hypothetical protein